MARKKKPKPRRKGSPTQGAQGAVRPNATGPDRAKRATLSTLGLYALGALAIGGGGTAFGYDFMRALSEQDLDRVGNGTPAIVQVHDPQCGLCRALQSETRRALKSFDTETVSYLVANIRNTDGAEFASRMGVGHVTLLLFDGQGQLVHVVNGVTPQDQLVTTFARELGLAMRSAAPPLGS
ncbi:MAG: thioredoxin domain-containing protein [Pseudomonadota bacterium]